MGRLLVAIAPVALLTACLPIPHRVQDLPAIRGTVTSGGAPMANIRAHVADITRANPCERAEEAATTDATGAFTTSGRKRIQWLAFMLPIHSLDTWAVALFSGSQPLGFIRPWHYRAGPRYAPDEVTLACELATQTCSIDARRRKKTVSLLPCEEFGKEFSPDVYPPPGASSPDGP